TVVGFDHRGGLLDREDDRELKRERLTKQYNAQYNHAVNAWRQRLFPTPRTRIEFPSGRASTFRFHVSRAPAFARISGKPGSPPIEIPGKALPHVLHEGVSFEESRLLFSSRREDRFVSDFHPIRGVLQNRPYDFALPRSGISSDIRLGVVCPDADSPVLAEYLPSLLGPAPVDSKEEYLLEYPGFVAAFGVPLTIATPGSPGW